MNADQSNGRQSTESSDVSTDSENSGDSAENPEERVDEPGDEQNEAADPEQHIQELNEKVAALEEERDELNERVLRKTAEFENYRRRMNREKKRRHKAGKLEVIEPILEVLDDFERSIEAAEELQENQDSEAAYDSLKGGVEMVFRKFRDTLENIGVEPIEAEGRPFDEELHEAMMRQPTDDAEPGTVLQEIRKGYRMGERVIRHSRVVVATEPSEEASSEGDEA